MYVAIRKTMRSAGRISSSERVLGDTNRQIARGSRHAYAIMKTIDGAKSGLVAIIPTRELGRLPLLVVGPVDELDMRHGGGKGSCIV